MDAPTRAAALRLAAANARYDAARRPLWKRAAEQLVLAVVRARARREPDASAAVLQRDLVHVLNDVGVSARESGSSSVDDTVSVEVRALAASDLGVLISLPGTYCSWSDSLLYVVERRAGNVRSKLAFVSRGDEARGDLTYAVSERFSEDRIVAAAWVPETCGRFHHGSWWAHYANFHLRIVRIGATASTAQVLFDDERTIQVEGRPSWKVRDDVIELSFPGNLVGLTSLQSRWHVLTFRATKHGVTRIAPFVTQPADLVDEWLYQPWSVARAWTGVGRDLRTWHRRLKASAASPVEIEAGPVGAPSSGKVTRIGRQRWRVSLECTLPPCEKAKFPRKIEVTVGGTESALRILRIDER